MDYFIKSTAYAREEAAGLQALAATGKIRVVRVLETDSNRIVLEKIKAEEPGETFWRRFGIELAQMHAQTVDYYGFTIDNHIGPTPQPNPRRPAGRISWASYFIDQRLKHMLAQPRLSSETRVHRLFAQAEPQIRSALEAVTEKPCLLHGDLWSGNFLCAEGQVPVLIDPAPYCGHREADLAMTELFGGFSETFYRSYSEDLPLQPGYETRRDIYNLYHVLNHWILFGGGYANQALSLLERTINLK